MVWSQWVSGTPHELFLKLLVDRLRGVAARMDQGRERRREPGVPDTAILRQAELVRVILGLRTGFRAALPGGAYPPRRGHRQPADPRNTPSGKSAPPASAEASTPLRRTPMP